MRKMRSRKSKNLEHILICICFSSFATFAKSMKKLEKLGAKMAPKMNEKSSLSRFVVIVGVLLVCLIFHKLLVGKRYKGGDTNPEKSSPGAKRMRGPVILGRPRGMRGASMGL